MKTKLAIILATATMAMTQSPVHAQANTSLSNLTSPTAVNQSLLPGTDNSKDLGSSSKSWKNLYLDGFLYLDGARFIANPGVANTLIGANTGISLTIGSNNIFAGPQSGYLTTSGSDNTFIGTYAGTYNTTGYSNTYVGTSAGASNTTGYGNSAFGRLAMYNITSGHYNSALGYYALYSNTSGYGNSALGYKTLYSNTTGNYNSGFGYAALFSNDTGSNNTAMGYYALYANTSGYSNSAMGYKALSSNTSGFSNSAFGNEALTSNTSGYRNSAFGNKTLFKNTTGYNNCAFGKEALTANTDGHSNVAVGSYSLARNSTGDANTAVGDSALEHNSTGNGSTAVGLKALGGNTTGSSNTALGELAGKNCTTGSFNTLIGKSADVNSGGFSNTTALGNAALTTASNQVRIGNSLVTSIGGYADWSNVSDGRIKKNIIQNVPGLSFINKLNPVTYNLDLDAADKILKRPENKSTEGKITEFSAEETASRKEKEQIVYTGFIAQQVEKAAKELNYDFSGVDVAKNSTDLYGLRYGTFVVPLVKAVQELDAIQNIKFNSQQSEIDALQKEHEQLEIRLSKLEAVMSRQPQSAMLQQPIKDKQQIAFLEQNVPNPFSKITTVHYSIPSIFKTAQLIVTDNIGKTVKLVSINTAGSGMVTIDGNVLAAGTYNCLLVVDGKTADSKKMILTK